jgi:hypothetical protein
MSYIQSVLYEQPHFCFAAQGSCTSTYLDSEGAKNPCRHHFYWAKIHQKVCKLKPLRHIQSHCFNPINVESSSQAVGGTHQAIPAYSRDFLPCPSRFPACLYITVTQLLFQILEPPVVSVGVNDPVNIRCVTVIYDNWLQFGFWIAGSMTRRAEEKTDIENDVLPYPIQTVQLVSILIGDITHHVQSCQLVFQLL